MNENYGSNEFFFHFLPFWAPVRGGARPFWDARGGPHFAPLMNTTPPLQYVCLCERKTVNENQI